MSCMGQPYISCLFWACFLFLTQNTQNAESTLSAPEAVATMTTSNDYASCLELSAPGEDQNTCNTVQEPWKLETFTLEISVAAVGHCSSVP